MPIIFHELIPGNAGNAGYAIAKELACQTAIHFNAVANLGLGIANASCRAAVAVEANPGLGLPNANDIFGAVMPFAIIYGNSQFAAGGLAMGMGNGALGGHAERAALTAANGLPLYIIPDTTNAVLFVELSPCQGCFHWLNGINGVGVPNPYNNVINNGGATTLNVWYAWSHPNDVDLMIAFHGMLLAHQLANIILW
ncbi:hypothetical protein I6M88_11785 [Citrobacter sedlakii]|uniref:Uncharacterized protein n=1 Tax=Citrobacter sedlakii TaxID=67826 RepID=A0ABS0ZS50_9ENTR|nr:hypothetical protein [Citrobacter sedlakii]MBJ8381647.1 hypothetical protein [Citrobacter sedlakii]